MQLNNYPEANINLKGVSYLFLLLALIALAYTICTGQVIVAAAIIALPIFLIACVVCMEYPMFSYILYMLVTLYFAAIYRYSEIKGLSVIMDIFLAICYISICFNIASKKQVYEWKNVFNALVIGECCWILFVLLELLAPYTAIRELTAVRGFFTVIPLSYFLSGLLLNSSKRLKVILIILGIYVITAAFKLYWQRSHGWDWAETKFLVEYEGMVTHFLSTGIRYFSFFSDAGNFGASMGMIATAFLFVSFAVKKTWFKAFCFGVTFLAGIGMVMSGTRGAIAIPFGGLLIYLVLCKQKKVFLYSITAGVFIFCFLFFTNIGHGNVFIRRARTALRPTQDPSFNVRLENQKLFAYYLSDKPFGIGLGGVVNDTEGIRREEKNAIPTDSYYVDILVSHGIVGVCVYLLIFGAVIIRCCYILLFKIQNPQLQKILTGLLAAVFGLMINAYVGRAMGATPCNLLVPIFLSFVLNGPYIESKMDPNYKF